MDQSIENQRLRQSLKEELKADMEEACREEEMQLRQQHKQQKEERLAALKEELELEKLDIEITKMEWQLQQQQPQHKGNGKGKGQVGGGYVPFGWQQPGLGRAQEFQYHQRQLKRCASFPTLSTQCLAGTWEFTPTREEHFNPGKGSICTAHGGQ